MSREPGLSFVSAEYGLGIPKSIPKVKTHIILRI